jgi:hypothetical protein
LVKIFVAALMCTFNRKLTAVQYIIGNENKIGKPIMEKSDMGNQEAGK